MNFFQIKLQPLLIHLLHLYLEDSIWQSYQDTHSDIIKQRNEFNEPSYFIDVIIDHLHTSVDFSLSDDNIIELGLSGQGTLEGYLTSARELASLSRLERRILGERLLRCIKLADSQEQSYSMIFHEFEKSAYLVLSMAGKRSIRRLRLYQLCAMVYCYFNANKIIGIATEQLSTHLRSYDVVGLKNTKFENHEELAEQAKSFFGKPYRPDITEYKGRIELDE